MTAIDDRAQASARMSEQGIEPAENRRKPGGQGLAARPPGLTAGPTVFALSGPARRPPRRGGGGWWGGVWGGARRVCGLGGPGKRRWGGEGGQGFPSRGVPCKRHLQPL